MFYKATRRSCQGFSVSNLVVLPLSLRLMVLLAELVGFALLVAGVALLSVPVGLMVLGVGMVAFAVAYQLGLAE